MSSTARIVDEMFERLFPKPIHPLTGKAVKYAIPPGMNPKMFCLECGLWKPNGFCQECQPVKWKKQEDEDWGENHGH